MNNIEKLYKELKRQGEEEGLTSISGLHVKTFDMNRLREWLRNQVDLNSDNPNIFNSPEVSDSVLNEIAEEYFKVITMELRDTKTF